jgi:3-oxoacyl-[acyl-carrier protein] reductase
MAPVAIVVGGTRRVGRWVSEALLVAGHRVHALYHSDEAAARTFVYEMHEAGYHVEAHRADALDQEQLTERITSIVEAEGALHTLVNCWGPSITGSLVGTSGVELELMFRGNVLSVHHAVLAAIPYLRDAGRAANEHAGAQRDSDAEPGSGDAPAEGTESNGAAGDDRRPSGGRIINFITAASETARAYRDIAAYAASKAMLYSYSRSLARELAGDGVTVNCISLGVAGHPPEGVPMIPTERIPTGRFVDEEDVAAALWYLTSPPASQVTGTVLNLGGGFNL